jgi:Na+/pantothenate symporter
MKKAWEDVKSFVTVVMTLGLVALLFIPNLNPPTEIIALYCTSYGSIMTYFFTKKNNGEIEENSEK